MSRGPKILIAVLVAVPVGVTALLTTGALWMLVDHPEPASIGPAPFESVGQGNKILVTNVIPDIMVPNRIAVEGLEVVAYGGPTQRWMPAARERVIVLDADARLMTFKAGSTTKYEVGKVADLKVTTPTRMFTIEGPLDAPTGLSELKVF